jgi:hypothetical protein
MIVICHNSSKQKKTRNRLAQFQSFPRKIFLLNFCGKKTGNITEFSPIFEKVTPKQFFRQEHTQKLSLQNDNVRFEQSRNVRFHRWLRALWKRSELP